MYFSTGWFCSMTVPIMEVAARDIRMKSVSLSELRKYHILDPRVLYHLDSTPPAASFAFSAISFPDLLPYFLLSAARYSEAALPIWLSGFRALAFSQATLAPSMSPVPQARM